MLSSLSELPSIDRLVAQIEADAPRTLVRDLSREVVAEARARLVAGESVRDDWVEQVQARLAGVLGATQRSVINATGIAIHTNLGRAPWAPEAIEAVQQTARYSNIEMDLGTGKRGDRHPGVIDKLVRLTGAESAVVVNNCAAAVLLALTAHAAGREVIVSRGQLVEIGGSFRVPSVVTSGGAELVEVGTTNRTRPEDVEAAITERTAVLMSVHSSNFRMRGFVRELEPVELVEVADAHGVIVLADLGSGCLEPRPGETDVRSVIRGGVHLAAFSGDKLLGGPQSGILVGRADLIAAARRHPLYRALRIGKATAAALEATLALHLQGTSTPVDQMLSMPLPALRQRSERVAAALLEAGLQATVMDAEGFAGGGTMPDEAFESVVVTVEASSLDRVQRRLRGCRPAIVARVADRRLAFDLRTVREDEEDDLVRGVLSVLG